ncbi:hypothetical protein [Deinococcus geothermalis]|uniref:hypothetical protein n=1 Tax=Deinococcus geothermalis TaxID=68909 RepID=UPI002356BF27|nr:hypothetical protein [Deinococcus geothermalis]
MYSLIIGGVALDYLPPPDAVQIEGGGRAVSERTTLDGKIIATRPPLPASRRLTITAPQGFAISAADAAAIQAIGDQPFTVILRGYDPEGTFSGCVFVEPPRFPPTSDPRFRGYAMTIYIPQEGNP